MTSDKPKPDDIDRLHEMAQRLCAKIDGLDYAEAVEMLRAVGAIWLEKEE